MAKIRLQKVLAEAGVDSRRNCEQLIVAGEVTVNRKLVDTLPAFVDPDTDVIAVSGRKINRSQQKVYFLLNKPKGVICTNRDPQGRKKAIDLIATKQRIFCAGRLDADTTGAIVLTNDSELVNRMTHPRFGLSKTYVVGVKGRIMPEAIAKLKKGIHLAEKKTGKATVKVLKSSHTQSLIEIKISEGLNRQIRRMLIRVGYKVASLKRTHVGKLTLRKIGVGHFRALTAGEVAYLKKATTEKS